MRPLSSTCLLVCAAGVFSAGLLAQSGSPTQEPSSTQQLPSSAGSYSAVPSTADTAYTADCRPANDPALDTAKDDTAADAASLDSRAPARCTPPIAPAASSTTQPRGNTPAMSSTQSTEPPAPSSQAAVQGDPVKQAEAAARSAALESSRIQAEGPQAVRTKVPYSNIPSLRDLYTQVPSTGGTLRRFGSEAFLLGSGNAGQLPSDLPAGPDYILGPGDQLLLNLWGSHTERLNIAVDRQGQIALPEAGSLQVNGLTIAQAQAAVQRALNTQFKDEHAEISLGRLRTVRVYVVGDVQRPGAYDVSALSTPLSVLYAAGGPTARGSLRMLKQMRGDHAVADIDLYDFLLKGVRTAVERLQPGDTILVPPVGQQVTMEGAVHHPAIYELNGESTLQQVLSLAGGVLPTASLAGVEVSRVEANNRRTMLSVDLPGNAGPGTASAFRVQAEDRVTVPQILPYNQQAVYLAGHVFRPGPYAFRQGLALTDVLRSYQDVLPEPASRGQIVRLVAPDLHPVTLPFQLADVLAGNSPTLLQPFDTVEVFGRYEADAPGVKIEGEVLRPGRYPLSAGMTVSALVEMAGGFNRSAFRDAAGLTSYTVQNGQAVEVGHLDVALAAAMTGDRASDLQLKPGDVLSIRQMTGWSDIGASITISGEVAHPGGYGLAVGERLSSILQRAGGLRPDAYPEAATFNRLQVQELNEQTRQDMIRRLESAPLDVKAGAGASPAEEQQLTASLQAQRMQLIAALRSRPANGRLVVNLSADISRWQGTPDDIVLRAGDTVLIPKRPEFVLIGGQVYNPTAISFQPGHDAGWYLNQGGGATRYGDRKRAYVLRANGSVVAHDGFGRGVLHARMQPGDAVVVPEKLITGSNALRDVLATAQVVSSLALTAAVAGGL